jgi:hypothetical protein
MSVTLASVKVRAGVVSFGDYVTAKGAGTLVDVGLTKGGVTIGPKTAFHPIEGDQYLGELSLVATKRELEMKFTMTQTDAEKLLMISNEDATTYRAGTTPNFTVNVDADARERYLQMALTIAGGGTGTTGLRVLTFWRCVVIASDPIGYKKDIEQMYAVTVKICQEISGTGLDTFYRQVDT